MARIAGVDLPREKRIEIALTYIYGIGVNVAEDIIEATGVNPDTRVKDLTEQDVNKIREYIEHNLKVEGDLRRDVSMDIKRMMEIGCYRGVRHRRGTHLSSAQDPRFGAARRIGGVSRQLHDQDERRFAGRAGR